MGRLTGQLTRHISEARLKAKKTFQIVFPEGLHQRSEEIFGLMGIWSSLIISRVNILALPDFPVLSGRSGNTTLARWALGGSLRGIGQRDGSRRRPLLRGQCPSAKGRQAFDHISVHTATLERKAGRRPWPFLDWLRPPAVLALKPGACKWFASRREEEPGTGTDVLESGIRRKRDLASHNLRNEHFRQAAEGTAGSGT